ncbi:MAG: ZIP family metal transporter [Bacteroidota bacterium]
MNQAIALFLIALLSGSVVFFIKSSQKIVFRPALVFSGAFFLSITILHILPEIYLSNNSGHVGIFVVAGYFLQQVIEMFTSGVEHGHLHPREHIIHNHKPAFGLVFGLFVHALLEGSILLHGYHQHSDHAGNSVFYGLALHKATAAFALMTVLVCQFKNLKTVWVLLILFSVASPLGYFLSDFLLKSDVISSYALNVIYALVAGNFLHISTTIFFESSPGHEHSKRNFIAALLGALLAIAGEWLNS